MQFAVSRFANENVQFLVADAERFKDGTYDLIVSFETLEHLDNRNAFLKNLYSMLSGNGALIISTPNKAITSPLRPPEKIRNTYHKYEYVEPEFIQALQDAGFKDIQKFGQHPYPSIFNNQLVSRLFRRWRKDRIETAPVVKMGKNKIPRYFVFIGNK